LLSIPRVEGEVESHALSKKGKGGERVAHWNWTKSKQIKSTSNGWGGKGVAYICRWGIESPKGGNKMRSLAYIAGGKDLPLSYSHARGGGKRTFQWGAALVTPIRDGGKKAILKLDPKRSVLINVQKNRTHRLGWRTSFGSQLVC